MLRQRSFRRRGWWMRASLQGILGVPQDIHRSLLVDTRGFHWNLLRYTCGCVSLAGARSMWILRIKLVMHSGCIYMSAFGTDWHWSLFCLQTIFPTVDLDSVNNALSRGRELTKEAILELNVLDADQRSLDHAVFWTPHARILEPEDCIRALVDGAWATAFRRYHVFHHELLNLHPRPRHRRHQPRKPHENL